MCSQKYLNVILDHFQSKNSKGVEITGERSVPEDHSKFYPALKNRRQFDARVPYALTFRETVLFRSRVIQGK